MRNTGSKGENGKNLTVALISNTWTWTAKWKKESKNGGKLMAKKVAATGN